MKRLAMAALALSLAPLSVAAAAPADERAVLADAARQPGAVTLPGLTYLMLKSGPETGPHPARADTITVRYTGRFADGKVFNTSTEEGKGTTTFELGKLIPGWVAALRLMRPGDQWRLYIPSYLAYGAAGKDPYIPPNATLVFDVELVSVTPAPPPAPAKP